MKARRVKGLDPEAALADNVERIVGVRVGELHAFMPKALDPGEVEALHDMRIAAKRLRYILELTAHAFGPYAATAAKRTKELQDLLGEIHDCDVTLPRVVALIEQTRRADAQAVRVSAGDAEDLDPRLSARAPHATLWRGLEAMAVHLQARRSLLFDRFVEQWAKLARDGFRARLEYAVAERPAGVPSDDDDGAADDRAGAGADSRRAPAGAGPGA
jgi:hypothetical protein